jgi:hypothetical protein
MGIIAAYFGENAWPGQKKNPLSDSSRCDAAVMDGFKVCRETGKRTIRHLIMLTAVKKRRTKSSGWSWARRLHHEPFSIREVWPASRQHRRMSSMSAAAKRKSGRTGDRFGAVHVFKNGKGANSHSWSTSCLNFGLQPGKVFSEKSFCTMSGSTISSAISAPSSGGPQVREKIETTRQIAIS